MFLKHPPCSGGYVKIYEWLIAGGLASVFLNLALAPVQTAKDPPPTGIDAQSSQDTSSAGSFSPGAGTVIVAELTRSLDAKKLKLHDPVDCRVTQDLLYKGKIIIPHGASVIGHVTEVAQISKVQGQSRLGIIFEKIILKDKKELAFEYPAIIGALGAPKRGVSPTTRPDQMPIQMQKGRTTGGALINALDANASLAGANMPSSTGAIGPFNRGVIGLKGLQLEPTSSKNTTIVSTKGDVKLLPETQLVLFVMGPEPK
jgi:hypothetical protein